MTDDPFADDRFTAMGLLMEVHAGISAAYRPELERLGLSAPAFEVLLRLARSPEHRLRMTELAGQSTLTNSGLTRLIDRLERADLVRREPCPDDGRATLARMTDEGFAKLASAAPGHVEAVRALVIDALDERQLHELTAIGDVILKQLDG